MAERHDPEESYGDQSERHKILLWEDFCSRAVEAGNRAIEYLELGDIKDEYGEDALDEIYLSRWESAGAIVEAAYNMLWPEIETLAIKLGVPFIPEIAEINE